ncbi:hypothetical protein [Mesorhizobium amorphae]|uniref:hypothetical protein n=1 Tax=Mesorhizobium amorphae TaxID=71433 RepID=UPI0011858C7C|nr:hypothetical protein [Mesorhizobium amorphae]
MTIESMLTIAISLLGILVTILLAWNSALRSRLQGMEAEIKDIREKYVRRDDLNGHIVGIQKSIDEVKDDTDEVKGDLKELTKLVIAAIQSTKRN